MVNTPLGFLRVLFDWKLCFACSALGATPSHQQETQAIDNQLWGTGNSSEEAIPIPPHVEAAPTNNEDMSEVEGGAVCPSHQEEKSTVGGTWGTVTPDTMPSRGPWEVVEEVEIMQLYPAKHPFIQTITNSSDPNETPHSITTLRFPLLRYH